jgi:hypothetical protein
MSLYDVLTAAVRGTPPEADGSVEVLPQAGLAAAVVAFSAHFYICADIDAAWVADALPPGDFSAPHGARFLTALADRLQSGIGALDVVLAANSAPQAQDGELVLEEVAVRDHPRVQRALRYREDVRVWQTPDGSGNVLLGRGLAGRWEVAFEVEPAARCRGLGRRLAEAARSLGPPAEPLFAQVSPGNAASLRAVLNAGYRPVCAEVLLPRS